MRNNPQNSFKRANAMFHQIGAIIAMCGDNQLMARMEIDKLGPYVSRGKGGGHVAHRARHGKHMDNVRKAKALRNKEKRG